MPDTAPGLESSLADDIARGKQKRARRRAVAALVVLAVAVAVAILTIVLDWGWYVWIAALVIVTVALAAASLRYGLVLRSAAVVAAVALVAAGVLVVRIPPITSAGWKIETGTRLIAADDDIAVTLDPATHTVRGRAIADGREVWKNSFGSSGTIRWEQVGAGALLLYADSGSSPRSTQAAVISITDGKTRWHQDVGQQEPFTANDEVVVFTGTGTGTETTTGIDLQTGKKLWTHAGGATAGSGGQSGYNVRRWVPRSDWIAIAGGPRSTPVAVLDARTGQVAAQLQPAAGNDFVIAGKTFIEFGYVRNGRRQAKGIPLAGGRSWLAEFRRSNAHELLDVVDGQARALYDTRAVYLDSETGTVREVALEDDWSVDWYHGGIGGRYIAVEQRDRERDVVARAVADTTSGELVQLDGRGQPVALTIEQFSGDTAISHTTVVDAVGAKSARYARIVEGAEQAHVSTDGNGHSESAGDVIQVDGRIVALRKD